MSLNSDNSDTEQNENCFYTHKPLNLENIEQINIRTIQNNLPDNHLIINSDWEQGVDSGSNRIKSNKNI